MKTKMINAMFVLALLFASSCSKSEENDNVEPETIELPPNESLAIDFSAFTENATSGKSNGLTSKTESNWNYPRLTLAVWNYALINTLGVPVSSFQSAANGTREYLGDNKWQWTYSVAGHGNRYSAKLTGELTGESILWEMYISKSGEDAFVDFLWFKGSTSRDGMRGEWTLNESRERPDPMLRIEWERDGDEMREVRYTWVRTNREDGSDDPFRNSYLEYGVRDGDMDRYYEIRAYDEEREDFVETRIEWNRLNNQGRVRSERHFEDAEWRCWNSERENVDCG